MDFRVRHRIFAATLCFLWDARLPAQTTPPMPVFRVPVRLVVVPTLVFSGDGRLVHGLDAANFHLFDEGHEQSVRLDTGRAPFSAAIVVQVSRGIHSYMPFIARTGSTFEALFLGLTGEAAVLSYGDEVKTVKPFEGAIQPAIASLRATDLQARMFDAGIQAVDLLKSRPPSRTRILVLIGQPLDVGSSAEFDALKLAAQAAAVTIFAVTLPQPGKPFVADTFTAETLPGAADRGGSMLTIDVGKLISVLNRRSQADKSDPFAMLAAATGGTQVFAAAQREFEYGIASIGYQLRSAYQLSFHSTPGQPGYHALRVEVDVPGAAVYSRPGYWHPAD